MSEPEPEFVEVPLTIYNAVAYRVFVLPDRRAVAAIVVTNDGYYLAMSNLVFKSVGEVLLSLKGIDRTDTKEVVFRVGRSTVSAVGYKLVAGDEYRLGVLTETIRYLISEALATRVGVVYAKGNKEVLPKTTPEEERLLELVPEEVPQEVVEAIEAIEISAEEAKKIAGKEKEMRAEEEEEYEEEEEEVEEIVEEL